MPDSPSPSDISSSMTSPSVLAAPPTSLPPPAGSAPGGPKVSLASSPCPSDSPSPPAASTSGPNLNGGGTFAAQVNGNGGRGAGGRDAMGSNNTCGSRQLSKVKRFLTTLQQFGTDISPEAGDRVRQLIFNLVNGTLSIDDFHHKLQDTTNFPLRPFVIPFLKANLPLLQREIVHCARAAKLSPQQYLHHHEHLLLEGAHSPPSTTDLFHHSHPSSSAPQPPSSSSLASEINENGKRRAVDSRHKDNGHALDEMVGGPPPHKRHHHSMLSPPLAHPASSNTLGLASHRLDDLPLSSRDYRDSRMGFDREYRNYGFSPRDVMMDERENDEEWKSIHTMLNCILGMVEKTKRALAILQHRSQSDRQELSLWVRRHAEGAAGDKKAMGGGDKLLLGEVSEVKRKAVLTGIVEEAVNEVKRQAVAELQKAVSAAEIKAREMVAAERGKMDKMLMEARVQAAEEALAMLNQQADSNEACWNCGRKASETCSGCNNARYCGSFCQHKDWENHHLVCGQGQTQGQATAPRANGASAKSAQIISSTSSTATAASSTSVSSMAPSASRTDSKTIVNDVLH